MLEMMMHLVKFLFNPVPIKTRFTERYWLWPQFW